MLIWYLLICCDKYIGKVHFAYVYLFFLSGYMKISNCVCGSRLLLTSTAVESGTLCFGLFVVVFGLLHVVREVKTSNSTQFSFSSLSRERKSVSGGNLCNFY